MAQQSFNAVEARDQIVDNLLDIATSPKYEGGRVMNDPDDDELMAFLEVALRETVEMIVDNHMREEYSSKSDAYDAVESLFTEENIEEISVKSKGRYASTHVYVWMTQKSVQGKLWANSAKSTEFKYSQYREHYNGNKAHAIIDVRPF